MKKKKKEGFTLVELLATIVILSIVFGIGYVLVQSTINKSKVASNDIAIENIKRTANAYVREPDQKISWKIIDEKKQISETCISVQDLVDTGYLKKEQVEKWINDSIYIYQDTKNIEETFPSGTKCQNIQSDMVAIPTAREICNEAEYNGEEQIIAETTSEDILLDPSTIKGKNAGTYTVKASLKNGKSWENNTKDDIYIKCKIQKKTPTITLSTNNQDENPYGSEGKTGDEINLNATTEINGIWSIKSTNQTHVTTEIIGNEKITNNQKIKIKVLAARRITTYITITVTPTESDKNNYNSANITYTIGKIDNIEIEKPTDSYCRLVTYDGTEQTLVNQTSEKDGFFFVNTTGKELGEHEVIGRLKYGYVWDDGTTEDVKINCSIIDKTDLSKEYIITFDCNGNTGGTMSPQTCGATCKLNKNQCTKKGYTFDYWENVADKKKYKDEATITLNSDITLKAIWKINVCTITYSPNGGRFKENANNTIQIIKYGTTISNMRNAYKGTYNAIRDGHHIKEEVAWINGNNKYSQKNGTEYKATDICKNLEIKSESVTLNVNWKINVCKVTYSPNGGKFTKHKDDKTESKNYDEYFGTVKDGMRECRGGYYNANYSKHYILTAHAWTNGVQTFNQNRRYKAQIICPDLKDGSQNVTLSVNWYANQTSTPATNPPAPTPPSSPPSSDNDIDAISGASPSTNGSSGGGGCFLSGTKIQTDKGLMNINDIKVGDKVLSYNFNENRNEYQTVKNIFIFKDKKEELYTLTIDGINLKLTSGHKVYTIRNNKGIYIPAKNLYIGDILQDANGEKYTIENIQHTPINKTVYNLEVDNNHNFYVGPNSILVHNMERINLYFLAANVCVTHINCDALK